MALFRFKRQVSVANAYGAIHGGSRFGRQIRAGEVREEQPCFGYGVLPDDVEPLPDPRDDGPPATIADIALGCNRLVEWIRKGYLSDNIPLLCRVVCQRFRELADAYIMWPDTPPLPFDARDIDAAHDVPTLVHTIKRFQQAIEKFRRPEVDAPLKEVSDSGKKRGRRGRPPGSKSAARDRKLFEDFRAAKRATGITKSEFLRERGLPQSDLAAIERGRAQVKRASARNSLDKNVSSPSN
jgi:hypothetical protein